MSTAVANVNGSGPGTALRSIDDLPLARAIGELKEKFAAALGKTQSVERFCRSSLIAITDPYVEAAAMASKEGRRSLYDALLKLATDGLLPDKREAALVVWSTKVKVQSEGG